MYIDIDVHHGDGVEEAFYLSNRVCTVSFHEFGNGFFPGSGGLDSIGEGEGKYFKINVPLLQGMDDFTYIELFKNLVGKTIEIFRPSVIVC